MDKEKDIKNYTYEEALSHLEEILSKMDRGDVPLEESMKNFEEGMKLAARCEEILSSYERRITKVIESRNGEIKEESMEE